MPEQYLVDAPAGDPDRPREWSVRMMDGPGGRVHLTHYAVLTSGEELTETPPRVQLTWQEWQQRHAEFGFDVRGERL